MATKTLIAGVQIFDGTAVADADSVLIGSELIEAVGSGLRAPRQADVIDGTGCTLLPGLIDAHMHTPFPYTIENGISGLRQAARLGITTMLCMGGDPGMVRRLMDLRRADLASLRSAGVVATARRRPEWGEDYPELRDVAEADSFVAARVAEGSDYLKIYLEDGSVYGHAAIPCLPPELSAAVTAAAHARGLLVITHAQSRRLTEQAIESGTDGLAHQFVDEPLTPDYARRIKAAGVFVVPTLAVYHKAEGPALADDPRLRPAITSQSRDTLLAGTPRPPHIPVNALAAVRQLGEAGVPILAGSDAANPGTGYGVSLHHELELLVRGGLTPHEALRAATSVPARYFRLTDRGRIAAGLRADLLLVTGDPLTDITSTRVVRWVWHGGRLTGKI
jgi:imidazolonepropionase-like amidohydrolase